MMRASATPRLAEAVGAVFAFCRRTSWWCGTLLRTTDGVSCRVHVSAIGTSFLRRWRGRRLLRTTFLFFGFGRWSDRGCFRFNFRGRPFAGDRDRLLAGRVASQGGLDSDAVPAEMQVQPLAPMSSANRRTTSIDRDLRSTGGRTADHRARARQRIVSGVEMKRDWRWCALRGSDRRAAIASKGYDRCCEHGEQERSGGAARQLSPNWYLPARLSSRPAPYRATPEEWITAVS